MLEARNLKCKVFDDAVIVAEPNRRFKDILANSGIMVPNMSGI